MFFNNRCCGRQNMMSNCCNEMQCPCDPVIEQPIEKCVTRDICHTVEQV